MEIFRILNNNVVLAQSPGVPYFIAMGSGIAFQKKRGDKLDEKQIERVFTLTDRDSYKRYCDLLNAIDPIAVDLGEEIISYAKHTYPKKDFNEIVHISLLDHISGVIEMHRKDYILPNPIWMNIRRTYPDEFGIGLYGVKLLNNKLGFRLGNDEASFIAMHFINAQTGNATVEVERTVQLTSYITIMVKSFFEFDPDEQSIDYYRFIELIKTISQYTFIPEVEEDQSDDALYHFVSEKHPAIMTCVEKIDNVIYLKHNKHILKDDMAFLGLHIERLLRKGKNK